MTRARLLRGALYVLVTLAALIIGGGLGFMVWAILGGTAAAAILAAIFGLLVGGGASVVLMELHDH